MCQSPETQQRTKLTDMAPWFSHPIIKTEIGGSSEKTGVGCILEEKKSSAEKKETEKRDSECWRRAGFHCK